MNPPLLKLAFVQGPREGDSLEYNPGSTIRIGRFVRGNEIAIRDAGISTKHLRIVSDSENWIIHDLGSSNGTILNSDTLDPDTPVILRHGDVIKLGEYTSIVVNFEADVQAQEHKLPPRPRRNNRRVPVPDPDPDPVQEKPTRKRRSVKQDEHEVPKRTRAKKSKTVEDIADNETKVAITKEEEVPVEKKANSKARSGKNTENVHTLGLNSVKLEVENTPKGVEISDMNRATRSKQIENASLVMEKVKSEDTVFEEKDDKRTTRATRSKRKEIGGDSFQELEMVLKRARKNRAAKKKTEQKPLFFKSVVLEAEARYDDNVEEDEKDVEAQEGCSERNDEEDVTYKRLEQVEIELSKSALGEEGLDFTVRVDVVEAENLQDTVDEERDYKSKEADDEETVEQESNKKNVEVDLEKMTLGEWFNLMEVYLQKQIVEETKKMIEGMRIKSLRVHRYIAEQKQAKGKGV